jgi:hypothetical protein
MRIDSYGEPKKHLSVPTATFRHREKTPIASRSDGLAPQTTGFSFSKTAQTGGRTNSGDFNFL